MRLGVGLLLAVVGTGCAAIRTADGTRIRVASDAFPAYVERVFREQNRVATELAFALEEPAPSPARQGELARAERALLAACAALNELAVARRDGVQLGLRGSLRRARQASDCETATLDAARALARAQHAGF